MSGLARWGDTLLMLNDGGNPGVLFAARYPPAARRPETIGALDVLHGPNVDWEALAAEPGGRTCACDIGDNLARRSTVTFDLLDSARRARTVVATYPDGPHNAEACYFHRGALYVLTKAEVSEHARRRPATLFRIPLDADTVRAVPVDTLVLARRSVTDASPWGADSLALVAYDYGLRGPFPYSRTSVYTVGLDGTGRFVPGTLTRKPVRAPFALTQYEAILPDAAGALIIASERTLWLPPRWRRVPRPHRPAPSAKP